MLLMNVQHIAGAPLRRRTKEFYPEGRETERHPWTAPTAFRIIPSSFGWPAPVSLTRDRSGSHGAPVGLHPRDPIAAANITHRRCAHSLQRALHGPHVEGARPGIRAQFGFAATDRREAPGLTREESAAGAGIHRTYVSDIERGPRNVRS
jgi:hypothetical protein